jgi:hypothetical protein
MEQCESSWPSKQISGINSSCSHYDEWQNLRINAETREKEIDRRRTPRHHQDQKENHVANDHHSPRKL